jgi:hypothetical protein
MLVWWARQSIVALVTRDVIVQRALAAGSSSAIVWLTSFERDHR